MAPPFSIQSQVALSSIQNSFLNDIISMVGYQIILTLSAYLISITPTVGQLHLPKASIPLSGKALAFILVNLP